ncbi:hypothetical protein BKA70DRAFT_1341511 [Coprinopsis sp. MPI-PUGE-AT-0042]|nr:hypothetical protein BKA70DRAFT_1341511 [Coprinopsis sp. MPI-PUGE-AT-0042]
MSASISEAYSLATAFTTAIADGSQLFSYLELAAAILDVLFTLCDAGDAIGRSVMKQGSASLSHPPPSSSSSPHGTGQEDHEALVQNQAQQLEAALEVVSSECKTVLFIGADYLEEHLVHRLSLAVAQKAVYDDHRVAYAYEGGEDLPPVTRCQRISQRDRFYQLVKNGIGRIESGFIQRITAQIVYVFARQAKVDMEREEQARKGLPNTFARTPCQSLVDHPLFITLFSSTLQRILVECLGCFDKFPAGRCLATACEHFFCPECVTTLPVFPPQCCKKAIAPALLVPHLSPSLRTILGALYYEYSTPPTKRVYCPVQTCSSFIGPKGQLSQMRCRRCGTDVCTRCRIQVHPGSSCEDIQGVKEVKALAEKNNWKACPKCRTFVERLSGCNHIACRCGQQFCYGCGKPWKKCSCRL